MIGRLGIKDWFFNGDIKIPKEWRQMPIRRDNPTLFAPDVSPDTPAMFYLLDGQSRPGGDGLAVMQSRIFGKNFNQYMIDIALGEDVREELSEMKPRGAAGMEVGFPDGGVVLSKLNNVTFADALEDETSGVFYVNLANILMYVYADELTPLTSFFHSSEHPIVGVSGDDTADVRRKLDRVFSTMGRTLYTHGGIDMYHPDHGLMQIRGAAGEPLTLEEAQEFVERLGDPSRPGLPPFTVQKIGRPED